MELYIIRHAQSQNNALESPAGRVEDPQLTPLGHRQAELLAGFVGARAGKKIGTGRWSDLAITRIISSPMLRALQTSQYLSRALKLSVEVWVDTHEWGGIYLDHGESGGVVGYPGQSRSDILRDFPDYILPENITDEGWWKEGREERSACQGRALKVAERLLGWSNSDQSIAMVSHGDFVDALLKALFSQLPGRNLYYRHWNTGITRIGMGGGDPLKIWYMNRIDHLEPGLVS